MKIKSTAIGFDNIDPRFFKIILPKILPYICHIYNTIITTSTFPKHWKLAKILPIAKPNGELRPISILSFLSKAFEQIIYDQINSHIVKNSMLDRKQSGFRKNRSCTTAIIDVVEDIRIYQDKKFVTFLLLLDFSKAFDTIDPEILCLKLYNYYKFSKTATKLIKSYLSERFQAVSLNSKISSFLPVKTGVPQGSVLGPLLFSLYINDLPKVIKHCTHHMYADDVQLYFSCPTANIDEAIGHINEDLASIFGWACTNRLLLNPTKSKCLLIFKKPYSTENLNKLKINSTPIEYVDTAKNLGFTFNKTLTWNCHINEAICKTVFKLRTLWNTQHLLPANIRLMIAKTYIIPTLLYGIEVFGNCDYECQKKLNVAFNNVARYVFAKKRYDHITRFANEIFGMPLKSLIEFKTLILLQKVICTKEPSYLFDKLQFAQSSRSNNIVIKRFTMLNSERQFFVFSVRLWNNLCLDLKRVSSCEQFKRRLRDKYLSDA